ncbi:hypothetical protein [uncultured Mediterranea sp.]|uniref:hypothetical protein n=1 Tax=uncultured Mediterranea sp. TaxID=1926662 RepID=UPI0027D944E3|nr:hypothetical protein [uncultured Mediterranea sp.]
MSNCIINKCECNEKERILYRNVLLSFGACTSTETVEEVEGAYYIEKIQELGALYGIYYEHGKSAPPMTKAEYEEVKRMLFDIIRRGQESD